MTQISRDEVLQLARLSSLQLSEDETTALQVDIEHILSYVKHLSTLNTDGVEPTYQVTELENVWRDDEIDEYGISSDALVSLAAESKNGSVKVPKVL